MFLILPISDELYNFRRAIIYEVFQTLSLWANLDKFNHFNQFVWGIPSSQIYHKGYFIIENYDYHFFSFFYFPLKISRIFTLFAIFKIFIEFSKFVKYSQAFQQFNKILEASQNIRDIH